MKNKDVFIEVSELRAIGSDNNNWMLLKRTKKKDQKTGAALGGYSEWSGYKYYSSLGSAAAKLEEEMIRTCGAQTFTELARMADKIHGLLKETFTLAESYKS